jgi:dihydrofolate reductase
VPWEPSWSDCRSLSCAWCGRSCEASPSRTPTRGAGLRKLVYYVAVTLDGFIAGPDGGDPSGAGFFPPHQDLIEFIVAEFPETLPGAAREAMGIEGPGKHFDTVLEGRGSYEVGLAAGVTNAYPHLRHLVFSTTMEAGGDPTVELVAADPAETARGLKAEEGMDIWVVGGAKLAHALLPEIDRLILKQHSSVIGSGIPLFQGPFETHAFRPAGLQELESGVRILSFDSS